MNSTQFLGADLSVLQERTGIHRNTWRNWFDGEAPSGTKLRSAANALGVKSWQLLRWIEKRAENTANKYKVSC